MTRVMKLSDIRIKGSFKNSIPNDYKLAQCREYWDQHGFYLHDIVVNNKDYLVNGYIQYLLLKENGIQDVVVKDYDKKVYKRRKLKVRKNSNKKSKSYRDMETLYVFGIHLGRTKERVWRVPNKFQKEWECILCVGDTVLAKTRYGNAPIIVTRIERVSECPVDMPVKKIVKKITIDNEEMSRKVRKKNECDYGCN
ncbi:hypothetical protein C804_00987 [Lachnospiraceae bacterium A4]|jgi:hypothetical protein|nr:hypothetical protein C804_00987 [Lachnospiraceae bacterium A4]